MKGKSLRYDNKDSILDSIDFRESEEPKAFRIGQQVRIAIKQKMKINGKQCEVAITDFGVIESIDGKSVVVSYKGKNTKYDIKTLTEINRQKRIEYSAWHSFVPR